MVSVQRVYVREGGGRSLLFDGIRGGGMMTADSIGATGVRAKGVSTSVNVYWVLDLPLCALVALLYFIAAAGMVIPLCSMRVRGEFRFEYKS